MRDINIDVVIAILYLVVTLAVRIFAGRLEYE